MMIVGHFFLAFSLTALILYYWGYEGEIALKIAVIAGMFSILPDLDIFYAAKELTVLFSSGFYGFSEAFWETSSSIHRGLTHSLIFLGLSATCFGLYYEIRSDLLASVVIITGTSVSFLSAGAIPALVTAIFLTAGLTITAYSLEFTSLKEFLLTVSAGLLLHPFGDVFTGTPPDLLYPFSLNLVEKKVILVADPGLNLFAVMGIELLLVWAGVYSYCLIKGRDIWNNLSHKILPGVLGFFLAIPIQNPSLSSPYRPVFSLLGLSSFIFMTLFLQKRGEKDCFYFLVNSVGVFSVTAAGFVAGHLLI